MLRNIFLVAPFLAFALPFATPQPSAARPLASLPQQTQWCSSEDDCGDEDDGDSCEDVTICVYAQLQVCDEDRQSQRAACSNTCAQAAASSCAASLGSAASIDTLTTCKTDLAARCESDCTRPQTLGIFDPTLGPKKPNHPNGGMDDDDHDDHDGDGDGGDNDDHDDGDNDDGDNDDHDCDDGDGGDSDDDCVTLKAQACIHVTRE